MIGAGRILLALAALALPLAAHAGAADADRSGARQVQRDAEQVIQGSRYDAGNPAFYYGQPASIRFILRRCEQRLPGATPSPRICRAAAAAAGDTRQ